MKKNHIELREIKTGRDLNIGHLDFVTTFAQQYLASKKDDAVNTKILEKILNVSENEAGDITLTFKNIWTV